MARATNNSTTQWTALAPSFVDCAKATEKFCALAAAVQSAVESSDNETPVVIDRIVRNITRDIEGLAGTALSAASHLLADLARQGWRVKSNCRAVWIAPPATIENNPAAEKERVRQQLHVDRLAQLREPAVRAFVREMEAKRIHGARFVSVFSLMRDGRDLAGHLRAARDSSEQLTRVIAPYLQFVEDEVVCEHTGLRLVDIWRYFRHTWANAYKSTPGRTMLILVRDAAAPMHPVMGIAALSSPAVQISVRDDWLGWSARVAIGRMQQSPNVHYARWACSIVDQTLAELYVEDFLEDGILTPGELRRPTDSTLARLKGEERDQREKHNRFMQSKEYKKSTVPRDTDDAYWLEQARTPLFRSKRAGSLADFLHVRTVLDRYMRGRPSKDALQRLLADRSGRQAMSRIIRKAKADRVGVAVAEISVCGAVQPYNAVLGGKLVAMMLTSPEVIEAYRRRYRHACSVIASSIAGRRIVRPTDLVLLGTTSLYAVGSSQYNRIRIPCGEVGGDGAEAMAYHELGLTEGYGTFHIGRRTAAALTRLLEQMKAGRRVHNIFGEGVNPRLRHIRDGMAAIGFPSDLLLKHGSPRIVYAVPLARNFADYLLGLSKRPAYYLQQTDAAATSQRIAEWWMRRWLAPRIRDDQVLERVAEHTLVRPIHHGARVELPPDDPDQARLF